MFSCRPHPLPGSTERGESLHGMKYHVSDIGTEKRGRGRLCSLKFWNICSRKIHMRPSFSFAYHKREKQELLTLKQQLAPTSVLIHYDTSLYLPLQASLKSCPHEVGLSFSIPCLTEQNDCLWITYQRRTMLKMKEAPAISSLIYNLRVGNSMLTMAGHCNVMLPMSPSISAMQWVF